MTPGGPIFQFLAQDHARLESLLARSIRGPADLDLTSFGEFRRGLLRHIALEEKLLVPAVTAARGGEPLSFARRLRVDHGALAALLVPTPARSTADELRKILDPHNALEEHDGPRVCRTAEEALRVSGLQADTRRAKD